MSSFFSDALGDSMISGGVIKLYMRTVTYVNGFETHTTRPIKFLARKSCQPLTPEEAQLQGFGDYSTNEFMTIYSLKKIPMPSKEGKAIVVRFNKIDWYVRKVQPWVWDAGTPMELGYYEITLSRFNENEVNPN